MNASLSAVFGGKSVDREQCILSPQLFLLSVQSSPHCQEAVRFDSCHLETCSPISSQQHNEMEKAASLSHNGQGGRRAAGEKLLQTKFRIGRRTHSYFIPPSPLSSNRELLSKERGIPTMTLDITIQLSRQCEISRRHSGDDDAVFPYSISPRYKHDPCWHRG